MVDLKIRVAVFLLAAFFVGCAGDGTSLGPDGAPLVADDVDNGDGNDESECSDGEKDYRHKIASLMKSLISKEQTNAAKTPDSDNARLLWRLSAKGIPNIIKNSTHSKNITT